MTTSRSASDNSNKPGGGTGPGGGSGGAAGPGGAGTIGDYEVARVGYGAMQLEHADAATATAVLRHAVGNGVNHIDTAHFYGEANARIRSALAPYADDLVLVTKVGAVRDSGGGLIPAQKPGELRAQVETNLKELGTDHIGIVNIRRVDAPPGIVAEGDQKVDLDSQLAELTALKTEGKIGGIGLSGVDAGQLRQALPAGIACVQNLYCLLDRTAEPVLDLCRTHGIAWAPFFPLGSAFARYPSVPDHPAVIDAAKNLSVTPAQVGLAWLLARYENTLLIPGTASVAHLRENIAAGAVRLPPDVLTALDQAANLL